jgi:hypothetical protein
MVEKPFFHKLLERAQVGLYAFVDALFIPKGVIKKSQFPVYKKTHSPIATGGECRSVKNKVWQGQNHTIG